MKVAGTLRRAVRLLRHDGACLLLLFRQMTRAHMLRNAGSINDGLTVVDLVKDPVLEGSLTRSTTPAPIAPPPSNAHGWHQMNIRGLSWTVPVLYAALD